MTPSWQRALGLLALLLLLAGWAQADALTSLVGLWWRSDTYAHGMLVPPIALWLAWRKRAQLAVMSPRLWWPALLPLAGAVLAGVVGQLAEVNALQHFAVLFTLQALVLLVLGLAVARLLAFPLLFLVFAVPFGDFLVEPMMVHTADFVVGALRLVGIPVFREGLQFMIPSGPWSVVEACSGLRYLFASAMVGTLYAYLSFNRWPRRLAFVLVSLVVPVVANWVRALLIVLLGHFSDNRIATGADHLVYGWVFFGFIMMLMFWIGNRWADVPVHVDPVAPSPHGTAPVRQAWLAPALAALLLAAPPVLLSRLKINSPVVPPVELGTLHLPGWQQVPRVADPLPWRPVFVGDAVHAQQPWQAAAGGPAVVMDLALYAQQKPDSKAINSMNELVPPTDFRWARQDGAAGSWRWSLREGRDAGLHIQARRLYWVGGHFTRSEAEAKLRGVWQLLAGQGDAQAVIVLMTPEQGGAAAERLDAFTDALKAPLNERLQLLLQPSAAHNPAR